MSDRGPRIANLMLDGIWDENVRTEEVRDLLAPIIRGKAIRVAPIHLGEEAFFTGGTGKLRLTNDADLPMRVEIEFDASPGSTVDPERLETLVDPNSVKLVDVTLKAPEALLVNSFEPVPARWKISFDHKEDYPLEVEGRTSLIVERHFNIEPRTQSAEVDGLLDEWARLPLVCENPSQVLGRTDSWTGSDDGSFRFGVEYDDSNLYIAIAVIDDRIILDENRPPWKQDGLKVRLDARPDSLRDHNISEDEFEVFLGFYFSVGESPTKPRLHFPDKLPVGTAVAAAKSERGFDAEISVPLSYLREQQGDDWSAVRLNVAFLDYDELSTARAEIQWRPNWGTVESFPGSGTFIRR